MQWIVLHDVGFGECLVLGGNRRDILMVDCGSVSPWLDTEGRWRFSDYLEKIRQQTGGAEERTFLLTHFHKDHVCGLPMLLKADPFYFQKIYLPASPLDARGIPLLLELSIFTDAFVPKQAMVSRLSAGMLHTFGRIAALAGTEVLYTLQQGDSFMFDGVAYDVLWPPRSPYPFPPGCVELSMQAGRILQRHPSETVQAFLELKDELCRAYVRCVDALAQNTQSDAAERQACVEDIRLLIRDLNYLLPSLRSLPVADRIAGLFCGQEYSRAYSDAVNGASLIFHNRWEGATSYEDVLFTGDATPAAMDAVRAQLRGDYYIVKAPHHGTAAGWWEGFSSMRISHVLISRGVGGPGGEIDPQYAQLNALCHCTSAAACGVAQLYGCCNRRLQCTETSPGGKGAGECRKESCGIFTTGPGRKIRCLCDI